MVANVAYCAAYLVDVFVQASEFPDTWQRSRWVLFAIGTTFAAVITRFVAVGMFHPALRNESHEVMLGFELSRASTGD